MKIPVFSLCLLCGVMMLSASVGWAEPGQITEQVEEAATSNQQVQIAATSFANRIQKKTRSNIGFSFGVAESFGSDVATFTGTAGPTGPQTFTVFSPSLFGSVKGQRTQVFFNYDFGYRVYSGGSIPSTLSHLINAELERRLSPHVSLHLTNVLHSAVNDYGALPQAVQTIGEPAFSQSLDVTRQRITQNSFQAAMGYQSGSRTSFSAFGGYSTQQYAQSTNSSNQGANVGGRFEYQVNKWFFLDNSYSTYLNAQKNKNTANIQRLRIANMKFELGPRRSYELSLGGGAEYTSQGEQRQGLATAQMSLSRKSRSTLLLLGYHRGFTVAVGEGSVVAGDNLTLSYTQWLSRRVSFNTSSFYIRGKTLAGSPLDSVSGGAGLSIALQSHLLLSTNYSHSWQKLSTSVLATPSLHRSNLSINLQYYLPSLTGR